MGVDILPKPRSLGVNLWVLLLKGELICLYVREKREEYYVFYKKEREMGESRKGEKVRETIKGHKFYNFPLIIENQGYKKY